MSLLIRFFLFVFVASLLLVVNKLLGRQARVKAIAKWVGWWLAACAVPALLVLLGWGSLEVGDVPDRVVFAVAAVAFGLCWVALILILVLGSEATLLRRLRRPAIGAVLVLMIGAAMYAQRYAPGTARTTFSTYYQTEGIGVRDPEVHTLVLSTVPKMPSLFEWPKALLEKVTIVAPETSLQQWWVQTQLEYPRRIAMGEDFEVHLFIQSSMNYFTRGKYVGTLDGPAQAEIRPIATNITLGRPATQLAFRWIVKCANAGRAIFRLQAQLADKTTATTNQSPASTREAEVVYGNLLSPLQLASAVTVNGRSMAISGGEDHFTASDVNVDLAAGVMTFPVDVLTDVGISRSAYAWLMLSGAALGGIATTAAGLYLKSRLFGKSESSNQQEDSESSKGEED